MIVDFNCSPVQCNHYLCTISCAFLSWGHSLNPCLCCALNIIKLYCIYSPKVQCSWIWNTRRRHGPVGEWAYFLLCIVAQRSICAHFCWKIITRTKHLKTSSAAKRISVHILFEGLFHDEKNMWMVPWENCTVIIFISTLIGLSLHRCLL